MARSYHMIPDTPEDLTCSGGAMVHLRIHDSNSIFGLSVEESEDIVVNLSIDSRAADRLIEALIAARELQRSIIGR